MSRVFVGSTWRYQRVRVAPTGRSITTSYHCSRQRAQICKATATFGGLQTSCRWFSKACSGGQRQVLSRAVSGGGRAMLTCRPAWYPAALGGCSWELWGVIWLSLQQRQQGGVAAAAAVAAACGGITHQCTFNNRKSLGLGCCACCMSPAESLQTASAYGVNATATAAAAAAAAAVAQSIWLAFRMLITLQQHPSHY